MRVEPDAWRFHTGTTSDEQRRRLAAFMNRRSLWALRHHGWRDGAGQVVVVVCLSAAVLTVADGGAASGKAWAVAASAAFTISVVLVGASYGLARRIRARRLRSTAGGWVAHWCEGPNGELAVRMTRPRQTKGRVRAGAPEFWDGVDLFGEHGAGRRLLRWLQELADEHGAVLVFRTTQPPLVRYYQRAGFTIASQPRLRIGPVQLGTTTLHYPAANSKRPGAA